MQSFAQAHKLQPLRGHCSRFGSVLPADPQRHGHVVQRAELGQQMVKLVHETQIAVAPQALLCRAQGGQQLALELHRALGGGIQPAQQMQQRAFARTRSAHDGQRFARTHLQVHPLQHGHIQTAFGETLGQALGFQNGITHNAAPLQD